MAEQRTNRVMLAGRGVALSLLAAAWLSAEPPREATTLHVVTDDADPDRHRARLERVLQASTVRLVVPLAADRETEPDLARELERALWRVEPETPNAVLIVSGGHWPRAVEPLLGRAQQAGLPVYWQHSIAAPGAPRILAVHAPPRAFPGDTVPVVVATETLPSAEYEMTLYANGVAATRVAANRQGRTVVRMTLPDAGTVRIDAELAGLDRTGPPDRLVHAATVNVATPPRLLLVSDRESTLGTALAAGGWPVEAVSTRTFPAMAGALDAFSALLLDDVPATALPDAAWRSIDNAVRRDGLGMLVMGGPHAFGLGAYRASPLEALLPVISEPPDRTRPAGVVFLVDVSGSMGRAGSRRLHMARAAVTHTAETLRPDDRVGLIGFDVEARELLPLASREDHAAAVRRVWPDDAGGGTRIAAALSRGVDALLAGDTSERLLVLVSDGDLSGTDVELLAAQVAAGRVEVIALLLDGSGGAPLASLAAAEGATVLAVDDVLRLPGLMREAVEARRRPLIAAPTPVRLAADSPFAAVASEWPALDACLVTRPRPEARLELASTDGDPVLATWTAGAGRVAALPTGLGEWSRNWLEWEHWPAFAARLVRHLAIRTHAKVRVTPGDGREGGAGWTLDLGRAPPPRRVTLALGSDPGRPVAPAPVAPGMYRLPLPDGFAGTATLTWEDDDGAYRHVIAAPPRRRAVDAVPAAARYAEAGLLREWGPAAIDELERRGWQRHLLAALALAVYLLTLVFERAPSLSRRRDGTQNR